MSMTQLARIFLSALTGLCSLANNMPAAAKIGDPAPALSIAQWISGSPVEIKPGTNIYVVEFWGALSGVSRAAIPLLNQVHNEFGPKGLVVVAISGEPEEKLTEFLRTHTPPPQYTIAADNKRKSLANYMAAFGQTAIPYCFVVGKDGKFLWHGVPQMGLTNVLGKIFDGTYDLNKAIQHDLPRAEMIEYLVKSNKADPEAAALGRKLLASRTNSVGKLYELAYRIITDVNNTNRDFALATQALDTGDKLAGKKIPSLVMARGMLVFEQGDSERGIALAQPSICCLVRSRRCAD